MTLNLVFQNKHFAIIDKPAAMLSVPSRMGKADSRPVAGLLLQSQLGVKIYPVHRLDEDVGGLLVFALTPEAHRAANKWFEDHQVIKIYEALSISPNPEERETWSSPQLWTCKLIRGKKRAYEAEFGKISRTMARLAGMSPESFSVWHLSPLTGRSHQLRYEMTRHGFPINGDSLYGSNIPPGDDPGIRLRAVYLNFKSCGESELFGLPPVIQIKSRIPPTEF